MRCWIRDNKRGKGRTQALLQEEHVYVIECVRFFILILIIEQQRLKRWHLLQEARVPARQ